MNTGEGDAIAHQRISAHQLESLTPEQVLAIDRALADLGAFGEVRIVKDRGRIRFIEILESRDMLKINNRRGRP
jgi:hypothetical protein